MSKGHHKNIHTLLESTSFGTSFAKTAQAKYGFCHFYFQFICMHKVNMDGILGWVQRISQRLEGKNWCSFSSFDCTGTGTGSTHAIDVYIEVGTVGTGKGCNGRSVLLHFISSSLCSPAPREHWTAQSQLMLVLNCTEPIFSKLSVRNLTSTCTILDLIGFAMFLNCLMPNDIAESTAPGYLFLFIWSQTPFALQLQVNTEHISYFL